MRAEQVAEIQAQKDSSLKTANQTVKKKRGNAEAIAPYKWKPGKSGNPGGRPKNDTAAEIARAIFDNNPELIYDAMVKALAKGNAYTFKELSVRAFGNVEQKVAITDSDEMVRRLMSAKRRVAVGIVVGKNDHSVDENVNSEQEVIE